MGNKQKLYNALITLYENEVISDNLMEALTRKIDVMKNEN